MKNRLAPAFMPEAIEIKPTRALAQTILAKAHTFLPFGKLHRAYPIPLILRKKN